MAGGDQAAAAALFEAVAEERAGRIARDRKDAAAAYRNLGTIAGLGDPARALAAYRKALDFDPDDQDTLLWVGWLSIDRGDLAEAERCLRRVLDLASGAAADVWHSNWARLGLGDVRRDRGDLAGASAEYEIARGAAERLAQADPGNAGWQHDLSVSYNRIGDVLVDQGNIEHERTAFHDGLAIRDRLAQADPGNAGWQRDLSVSHDRIGDVLVAQGSLEDALTAFRDGLAIADRLAQDDPDNAGWQRDLAASHGKLGLALRAAENNDEALEYFSAGSKIMRQLVERFPDWVQWQRDRSTFDRLIADMQ